MRTEVYTINKGVNRPIEFRGLQAQYIGWLVGGMLSLLAGFAILYLIGLNPFVTLGLIGVAAVGLTHNIYRLSRKYGQHGLMKRSAAQKLPQHTRITTRNIFLTEA